MLALPLQTAATSSSSRKITLLVCSMMADASLAKKYSTASPKDFKKNIQINYCSELRDYIQPNPPWV